MSAVALAKAELPDIRLRAKRYGETSPKPWRRCRGSPLPISSCRTRAAQAVEVALRMLEAGVDAVGVHLQADARRADQTLIKSDYLNDVARAIFERVGNVAPVQVVGGLTVAQGKNLAQAGLRAFVISGNLGQPDGRARYDLPRDQIERHVADFIAAVSSA
jgi:3-hexulose-6-phosphate synthase